MNLFALAGNLIKRVPIERVLFPPRDNSKALQDLAASLEGPATRKETAPGSEVIHDTQTAEKPSKIEPQEAPRVHRAEPQPGGISLKETLDYQNREIGKLLLRMERHYAQKLRIAGVPCDCGSSKHLLDIESLCEETIPMVDNPQVYYHIMNWVKEVGPKSTDEAAKSGLHDEEYPHFAHQARGFRKEIIGSLEPSALFPQKPGEPEGTRILPVASAEEIAQIREKAHQKVEEVLGLEKAQVERLAATLESITPEEWHFAEGMWQITKEDADRGEAAGVYLWQLLNKYYPGNKDKQVRFMGFMGEVQQKYREHIPRDKAWELARKWGVESMLTKELLDFMPQLMKGQVERLASTLTEETRVIPTEPRPRRETDLEYLADSPEYLAQTIDNTGYRSKLENAFQEAIARVKGLK